LVIELAVVGENDKSLLKRTPSKDVSEEHVSLITMYSEVPSSSV